ncbi:MAG: Thioredoxin reductase [Candidatus Heimdallarchaeota archaeon LC_2]|nr:MAG: Thioredoxin reductase [Candidatus Heimdallarchaeota archaeon LC_2]
MTKQKPVILVVDDEVEVLNAVLRDLRSKYGKKFRIVKAISGEEALEITHNYKKRGMNIALFVSDQRMPGIDGTEFLEQAIKLYPYSKRILLTAYADTQAAIQSINDINLDYYLVKPWDPPEQHLFPIVDDLLFDWEASNEIEYAGIRVVGYLWSSDCHVVKDFLARNLIPYQWLDIELDEKNEALAKTVVEDLNASPVIFFPDGDTLTKPSIPELAKKIGLKTEAKEPFYDLVVIGAGPAGLAAGVYGASEGLSTIVIEKEAPGGQAGTSSRIENYLGFPKGISGADLTRRAVAQVERLGAELMLTKEVMTITINDQYKIIKLSDGSELRSRAVLIATGVQVNEFNVPGIEELSGSGVYYGASLTEAVSYKDKDVFVLGGGNSAGQGAMFFSRYASKVHVVIRRSDLEQTMSKYLIDRLEAAENVDIVSQTEIIELKGDGKLEQLVLKSSQSGESSTVSASALFIFIGAKPNTKLVEEFIDCDGAGFIKTDNSIEKWTQKRPPYPFETKTPGIFAVGDVRSGSSKRVAAAVGEGAVSVQMIHRYLSTV